MKPRTLEFLSVLTRAFNSDLRIQSVSMETDWETTHYIAVAYLESLVVSGLNKVRLEEYLQDGVAAVMDSDYVFESETLDDVIEQLFWFCQERNLLEM